MNQLLIVLVVGYLGVAGFAALVADRMIFLPPAASYRAEDLGVGFLPSRDGRVAYLHLPNDSATHTILYSHGNAEDLGHLLPILLQVRDAGFSVIAYDYRGYGASSAGPPTTRKAEEDLVAVFRFAVEELGIPPERLVPYGRSVGSGPAVALAASEPVGGLIVESGFVSAYRVVTRIPLLPGDRYPNLRRIRRVGCAVLVIHGTADAVIPVWHGRRLYEAAPAGRIGVWLEGAGHNDVQIVAGESYRRALGEFARELGRGVVRG